MLLLFFFFDLYHFLRFLKYTCNIRHMPTFGSFTLLKTYLLKKIGADQESNSEPLAPEARIIDHQPTFDNFFALKLKQFKFEEFIYINHYFSVFSVFYCVKKKE